ncbi:hypothetical protein [Wolbachia endosymbiont of Brugia pahangi]|nr:hypothetical protein [Wolbachia endosymbiont of Brugia pahangi]
MFSLLKIKAEQVVDKSYEELSRILKKQHRKLILVDHSDKGGEGNRFI